MSILRSYLMDVGANTATDSLMARKLDLSNLTQNSIALATHHLVLYKLIQGRLSNLLPDASTEIIIENYLSQFLCQYGTEMALGEKDIEVTDVAKRQMFYSIGQYLLSSAKELYPSTGVVVNPGGSNMGNPAGCNMGNQTTRLL